MQEIVSAVKVFEEIEKVRRGCEARLTHLSKNRKCLSCGKDFMPKRFEVCPECSSENSRIMKKQRKCKDCGHTWEPSPIGVCVWCGSDNSEENPKDDSYLRNIAIPRLLKEEEFYEKQMMNLVKGHPVWTWAKDIKGVGLTSLGRIIGRSDIKRLNTVSAFWAHCGFGLNKDGSPQRKRQGEQLNYDPQLQSACIMLGESLMKQKDSYYEYYLREKEKIVDLTKAHAHNRSFRHMIKLFQSHLWQVWREVEGLEAPMPYVFGILKHPDGHYISPWNMVKKPYQ